MRIPGVGPQYSDLLVAAGVNHPRNSPIATPGTWRPPFQEVVAVKPGIVRRVPSYADIDGWIENAGKLEKVVTK
jgi:hypothetical protein